MRLSYIVNTGEKSLFSKDFGNTTIKGRQERHQFIVKPERHYYIVKIWDTSLYIVDIGAITI